MKTDIEEIKRNVLPILKEVGVTRSAIFGSVAHGEDTKESDIDILIDFPRGKSFFDLVGLEMELEKKLGRKVDLVTYNSLHPLLRDRILSEQVQIL